MWTYGRVRGHVMYSWSDVQASAKYSESVCYILCCPRLCRIKNSQGTTIVRAGLGAEHPGHVTLERKRENSLTRHMCHHKRITYLLCTHKTLAANEEVNGFETTEQFVSRRQTLAEQLTRSQENLEIRCVKSNLISARHV